MCTLKTTKHFVLLLWLLYRHNIELRFSFQMVLTGGGIVLPIKQAGRERRAETAGNSCSPEPMLRVLAAPLQPAPHWEKQPKILQRAPYPDTFKSPGSSPSYSHIVLKRSQSFG